MNVDAKNRTLLSSTSRTYRIQTAGKIIENGTSVQTQKLATTLQHDIFLIFVLFLSSSIAGCFSKDQVYLDGILKILRYRDKIDFPLLMTLGKVRL